MVITRFLAILTIVISPVSLHAQTILSPQQQLLVSLRKMPDTAAVRYLQKIVVTDTSSQIRATATSAFSTYRKFIRADSQLFNLYWKVTVTDPSSSVRSAGLIGITRLKLSVDSLQKLLISRLHVENDSGPFVTAVSLFEGTQSYKDTILLSILSARINNNPSLNGVPTWILAQHQRIYDIQVGTVLPWFMREPPPVFNVVPSNSKPIRFFAFGDWGDHNKPEQQKVATAIRTAHQRVPFTFGITTGDNFYGAGIESPLSPRWNEEYEKSYGAMNIPVYGVLGNHDIGSEAKPVSAAAEIAYMGYSKTWKMPATHYTFIAGPAQFFVLDTESMTPWELVWLDKVLASSKALWKVVVGHHDIYSNRSDASDERSRSLLRILKRHNVPVYLNGHYHTLQRHQVDGTDYITSGAGGRILYDLIDSDSAKYGTRRKFAAKSYGFAVIDITRESLILYFINQDGKEIYKYERTRPTQLE